MDRDTIILLAMIGTVTVLVAVALILVADAIVMQPTVEPSVNMTGGVSLP